MQTPFDYAIKYLSRYPKTAYEMRIQLKKKGYAPEEIDETIPVLEKRGFLDDTAYAKLYLSSEVVRRGKSLAVMMGKLRQKGVDRDILKELAIEMETDLTEGTTAKINKEIEKLQRKGLEERVIIQKLASRGYKIDQIRACLHPKEE